MSITIINFPLDEETGYPRRFPMGWQTDSRKLYAAAHWLRELIDSGDYSHLIEHNDDAFIITEGDGKFKLSFPVMVTEQALYVLADMLKGMADFLWYELFGRFLLEVAKNKPKIFTPKPPGIAG